MMASMIALLADGEPTGLNAGGWVMMVLSISMVIALTVFCMWRILRESTPTGRHHAPLDIDTKER